jgi:hypothetical protein
VAISDERKAAVERIAGLYQERRYRAHAGMLGGFDKVFLAGLDDLSRDLTLEERQYVIDRCTSKVNPVAPARTE